jgi:hypothetical protein
MRLAVVVLSLAACTESVAHPPYAPQPTNALVEVDLPPPPGRVESIPERPSKRDVVWVDGEWTWHRARWAWKPGRWVATPAGGKFMPWVFVRGPDGRLWYAPGAWRDAKGAAVDPPALAVAQVDAVEVVNASGDTETTGPTLRTNRGLAR